MSRPGFTLLEALVVIAIIGLLATITMPNIRAYQSAMALRTQARQLASDLRTAQELTVSEQVVHYVEVAAASATYHLYREGSPPTLLTTRTIENDIEITDVTGPADGQFRYNSYGAVSVAGAITLTNENGDTFIVTVRPSGYVSLE